MKVLIACERSGVVREAFRERGHDAWSCDLVKTERPGQHIIGDIREVLEDKWKGGCWDLMIAHPDCTYLSNSGVHWLHRQEGRWERMRDAAQFFRFLLEFPTINRVAVENPVMHKYAVKIIGRKHGFTIQPYQFGHPESKRTCFWTRNLRPLHPTNILPKPSRGYWDNQTPSGQNKLGPSEKRAMTRARTYEGIAKAIADQWGS